jgi:NAD(P)-dependent dehydrogenase (short-subunit alcohol dehydrogenase family)
MSKRFSVSRAVVTGGAQGIGAAIAHRLASEGISVTLLDVNEERAQETAQRISADTGSLVWGLACDVTDRAQVRDAFSKAADAMDGLDTYIGNAGITRDRMFHKLTDDDWDKVISVNLTGVFAGLQAAAPWLRTDGPGRVVLISSVVAKTGNLGQMNYIAAKAGVVGLVRSGAAELARFGTTVNGIRPGFIETAMTAAMPEAAQAQLTANPIGRAGQPEDIAGAVAFLCSDDASFITGHILDVNGGSAF